MREKDRADRWIRNYRKSSGPEDDTFLGCLYVVVGVVGVIAVLLATASVFIMFHHLASVIVASAGLTGSVAGLVYAGSYALVILLIARWKS